MGMSRRCTVVEYLNVEQQRMEATLEEVILRYIRTTSRLVHSLHPQDASSHTQPYRLSLGQLQLP
jgi:hypothetical protein